MKYLYLDLVLRRFLWGIGREELHDMTVDIGNDGFVENNYI